MSDVPAYPELRQELLPLTTDFVVRMHVPARATAPWMFPSCALHAQGPPEDACETCKFNAWTTPHGLHHVID